VAALAAAEQAGADLRLVAEQLAEPFQARG